MPASLNGTINLVGRAVLWIRGKWSTAIHCNGNDLEMTLPVTACRQDRTELVTGRYVKTQALFLQMVTRLQEPFPKLDVVGSNPIARFYARR